MFKNQRIYSLLIFAYKRKKSVYSGKMIRLHVEFLWLIFPLLWSLLDFKLIRLDMNFSMMILAWYWIGHGIWIEMAARFDQTSSN